jgi:glycosyltransferase involved in cell wall biosynthesis
MRDEFVPEEDVQLYYRSADIILAPYQRHVGMSGVLVNAAAAQKPLLCSNYGLMGEITRQWQLGLTVDSTSPDEIAKGLTEFLAKESVLDNKSQMKAFAMANSTNNFAKKVFQNV